MENYPVLFSYRRCPYAMRARVGLYLCGIQVEQREIVFWDKPEPMLAASPKGTVPVLILPDGQVIDESRDILFWAVEQARGSVAVSLLPSNQLDEINCWFDKNDNEFKEWLDKYKYADRFPEQSQTFYRQQGEKFLAQLESQLTQTNYLLGEALTLADIAIFPFVRQFANVDKAWFKEADYPCLRVWLNTHLEADYFASVMKNRPVWQAGHQPLWVDEPELHTRDQFTRRAEESS